MLTHKLIRNLLRQSIHLIHRKRHGSPLTVPANTKRFSVGPDHYETSQFRNLVKAKRGNPAFLVVIGEEKVPEPIKVHPRKAMPSPKAAKVADAEKETLDTRDSFFGKKTDPSKKVSKPKDAEASENKNS